MIVDVFGQSLSPGNEQRDFWSSAAAKAPGSRNTIGIRGPRRGRADRSGDRSSGQGESRRPDQGLGPHSPVGEISHSPLAYTVLPCCLLGTSSAAPALCRDTPSDSRPGGSTKRSRAPSIPEEAGSRCGAAPPVRPGPPCPGLSLTAVTGVGKILNTLKIILFLTNPAAPSRKKFPGRIRVLPPPWRQGLRSSLRPEFCRRRPAGNR